MKRSVCTRAGVGLASLAAVGFGSFATEVVGHADTSIPGINTCPTGNVYVAEYNGGNPELVNDNSVSPPIVGGAAVNRAVADADGTSAGSSVGDTVIVCPGTYSGVHAVVSGTGDEAGHTKDNVTVRSFAGPGQTILISTGIGSASSPTPPVFTVDANGVTIGGPGFGFTIENPSSGQPASPLIEVGTPGAQSTANEDETIAASSTACASTNAVGCDQQAPTYVAVNDAVIDNIITKVVPQTFSASATTVTTGIELDNTINNTVQSNLITNAIAGNPSVGTFEGIAIGSDCTNCGTASNTSTGNGYSTNINTALFQNDARQLTNGNPTCSGLSAISIDGFALDSQVYNNLIGTLTNTTTCKGVVGIESNAFGQLENEQTGTLVPVNGNIDDNTIQQLGPNNSGTAIVLDPQPTQPISATDATTCDNATMSSGNFFCTYPPSSYTVTDNQIQNVAIGIHVESLLGGNSYAHYTNFQNVKIGVEVDATAPGTNNQPETTFDATNNFWGCDDGPVASDDGGCATVSPTPTNPSTGPVYWNPWLASPVEQAGDEAGDNAGQS